MTPEKLCRTCRLWRDGYGEEYGWCHLNPLREKKADSSFCSHWRGPNGERFDDLPQPPPRRRRIDVVTLGERAALAASRTAFPALIAELERAQKECAKLQAVAEAAKRLSAMVLRMDHGGLTEYAFAVDAALAALAEKEKPDA